MLGAGLFRFPTFFLSNMMNNKISHLVKVTCNEGHHHLTFDI